MSKKIAIVADSSGSLPEEVLKEHNIHTSYLMIIFGTESYQEFKEITPSKFLELSEAQQELPSTSQPSPGVTVELYESLLSDGYDEIIHITISSGLSGAYQSALSAAEMVNPDKIHVFDSESVAWPQGALAIEASKMVNQGLDSPEIIEKLNVLKATQHISASVKTLENLRKGGRLSNASAVIGGVLQIKPIVSMINGKLEAVGKVRTFNKAIATLIETVKNANLDTTYEVAIMHMQNLEDASTLKSAIEEIVPGITVNILPLSLVVSVHVGEGTIGVTWIKTS